MINMAVNRVSVKTDGGIMNHEIRKYSLRIIEISYSSFSNNVESFTKLGYKLLLLHNNDQVNLVLRYSSYKSKRIVRSVLGV